MSFEKTIPSKIAEYEVYNASSTEELRKVASERIDLPDGFEYDPDYFYMWIRIISAGESYGPNKNGDYFPKDELLKSYETFFEAHVFKNHENKKIEKAIGRIFTARWNPVMRCVEIFKGVDRKLAPEIVRGFEKGFLTDVSMGCKVPYTVCSVCGNKARKQSEFCDHVRLYRMQYLGNGERVFEINYEPKFHDSSVVLNGAERVAKAMFIVDNPNGDTLVQSFQKAASSNGTLHFTRLSDYEMEKVAAHQEFLHPLLRPYKMPKAASENVLMQKLAEIEKEVTGKLLNIVSNPHDTKPQGAEELIQIIKFLGEKRLDESNLKAIAQSLSRLADAEKVPVSKVFSTFLGVAEVLGIELFPTELHTILCELTYSKFDESMKLSEGEEKAFPSDFAKGVRYTNEAAEQLPQFADPSSLVHLYDDIPEEKQDFVDDPANYMSVVERDDDLDEESPVQVVKVVRQVLEPFMPMRSRHPEHLVPRLSAFLQAPRFIGEGDVSRDVQILKSPDTFGDVIANIAYSNYQSMRPKIVVTRMIKSACLFDGELEKTANIRDKGISRWKILAGALPVFYGASAFEKSRRENGRNMSDVENFIADRPDVLTLGTTLAGKPLSMAVAKGQYNTRKAAGKAIKSTQNKAKELNERMKDGFNKLTAEETTELVKIADSLESGEFTAFSDDMLSKFAGVYGMDEETTAAIKLATLLSFGDMEKEAQAVLSKYQLDEVAVGEMLKFASEYTDGEMEKAAEDMLKNLTLDALADNRSFATTMHGRLLDALVFKKIGEKFAPQESANKGGLVDAATKTIQ